MPRKVISLMVVLALIVAWELGVKLSHANRFVVVAPSVIIQQFRLDWPMLLEALWFTLKITWAALALAIVTSVPMAFALHRSTVLEAGVLPVAVALQVTPIIAIAPIVLVWVGPDNPERALLVCAWLATFFPIFASALSGLRTISPDLRDLFSLYRASGWQRIIRLELPASVPSLMSGLKIASGSALIGAVVAEFAIGGVGNSAGLAWALAQATKQLEIARAFACLILLTGIGVIQYLILSYLENNLLKKRGVLPL